MQCIRGSVCNVYIELLVRSWHSLSETTRELGLIEHEWRNSWKVGEKIGSPNIQSRILQGYQISAQKDLFLVSKGYKFHTQTEDSGYHLGGLPFYKSGMKGDYHLNKYTPEN